MTEITREKVVKEVTGYQAFDGTFFREKEECEKYEESAKSVVKKRFYALGRRTNEDTLSRGGRVPLLNYNECTDVFCLDIKDKKDVDTCNLFCELSGEEGFFTDDFIGKKIIVEAYEGSYVNILGTVDEVIKEITTTIMNFVNGEEKE